MKLQPNKIFVKFGNTGKYVEAEKVKIGDRYLGDLVDEMEQVKMAHEKLTEQLKDCIVVNKDEEVLIEIDGKLQRSKLVLHEDRDRRAHV